MSSLSNSAERLHPYFGLPEVHRFDATTLGMYALNASTAEPEHHSPTTEETLDSRIVQMWEDIDTYFSETLRELAISEIEAYRTTSYGDAIFNRAFDLTSTLKCISPRQAQEDDLLQKTISELCYDQIAHNASFNVDRQQISEHPAYYTGAITSAASRLLTPQNASKLLRSIFDANQIALDTENPHEGTKIRFKDMAQAILRCVEQDDMPEYIEEMYQVFEKISTSSLIRVPDEQKADTYIDILGYIDPEKDIPSYLMRAIEHVPTEDIPRVIRSIWENPALRDEHDDASKYLEYAPQADAQELAEYALDHPELCRSAYSPDLIKHLPENRFLEELENVFARATSPQEVISFLDLVELAPIEVQDYLRFHAWRVTAKMFHHILEERVGAHQALLAITAIGPYLTEPARIQLAPDTTEIVALTDEQDKTQGIGGGLHMNLAAAAFATLDSIPHLTQQLLTNTIHERYERMLLSYADLVDTVPAEAQEKLWGIFESHHPTASEEPDVTSPLHSKAARFLARKLKKDGSETIIRTKKYEASTRIIQPGPFKEWTKAYLAESAWKEAGFDYIPIEPITGFKPASKNGLVMVNTVNLRGASLGDSIDTYPPEIRAAMLRERKRIIDVLDSLNIEHGHPHLYNFVLIPQKNEAGELDKNSLPRMFMIDFDQARPRDMHPEIF